MKKMINNWTAGFITILMIFGLVIVVLLQGNSASGNPSQQQGKAGPENAEISRLRTQLQSESLSAEGRRSLKEKLEMAERMAPQPAVAGQERSTKVAPPLPPIAQFSSGENAFLEGIFEGSEGLIRPSLADINNLWQGIYNGKQMQIFAGSFSAGLGGEGVLIVIDLLPDQPTGAMMTYAAPEGTGALRILDVGDSTVVLENETGGRLLFDLASRSFK